MNKKFRTEIDYRIYNHWYGMHKRCYDVNKDNYKNFGNKGIAVDDIWNRENPNGFENFLQWSKQNGYKTGLHIDRIDKRKNYSPNNCRWATSSMCNTRLSKKSNNKSGYTGIIWDKVKNKWRANISVNYKDIHIGYFENKKDALDARNNYIIKNNLNHTIQEWKE